MIRAKFRLPTTGRRASRLTQADQAELLQKLGDWLVPLDQLQSLAKPLVLEIGAGMGDYMAQRAANEPATQFLACELYLNGLSSLAHKAKTAGLTNVKLTNDDARDVIAAFPDGSLQELVILYPDPWPKARHHKRRLIQTGFIKQLQPKLVAGGRLFLATDIADYAEHMQAVLREFPEFQLTNADQLMTPPAGWVQTKYERKALAAGRIPQYFLYDKNT